jgi:hypothetical protein
MALPAAHDTVRDDERYTIRAAAAEAGSASGVQIPGWCDIPALRDLGCVGCGPGTVAAVEWDPDGRRGSLACPTHTSLAFTYASRLPWA